LSDKPADKATKPPKSKKLLLVVAIVLVIVALGAGGAWFYVSKQRAAALDGEEEEAPVAKAQIGITLELSDAHATDKVKQYLPTIRSGILLLVSQKTSEELLQREGKEKLAADILKEAARPFGGAEEEVTDGVEKKDEPATKKAKSKPKVAKKNKSHDAPPVQRVLFSSFIVQ
jgi:flagellar FliL protein